MALFFGILVMSETSSWRLIAHRGAPRRYRENTLPSFAQAIAQGAQYVELDVHLTRDGQLVVHHDPVVRSPAQEVVIAQSPLSDFQVLNLPFVLPTLSEILNLCALHHTACYVEIKPPTPSVVELVLADIERTNALAIVSSFHHPHLERSKKLAPHIPTMALLEWDQGLPVELIAQNCVDEIGVGDNLLALEKKHHANSLGLPVFVYTVNDAQKMEQLRAHGFAGVFTDTF